MNGVELTERLITDIKRSIETRNSVPDINAQIKVTDGNLGNFVGALNAISFDPHLNIVVNLINGSDPILKFEKDNIQSVLDQISENQEEVSQRFQEMLDNENLVSLDDRQPVRKILIEKLDDLHGYSGRYLF